MAVSDLITDPEMDLVGRATRLRNPRKPIGRNARMPISDSAHADWVGAKRRSGKQLVAD
jgi:hypothetical protein